MHGPSSFTSPGFPPHTRTLQLPSDRGLVVAVLRERAREVCEASSTTDYTPVIVVDDFSSPVRWLSSVSPPLAATALQCYRVVSFEIKSNFGRRRPIFVRSPRSTPSLARRWGPSPGPLHAPCHGCTSHAACHSTPLRRRPLALIAPSHTCTTSRHLHATPPSSTATVTAALVHMINLRLLTAA